MPVGTVTRNTEQFDLTTLPGAYVVIRRMNFGEKLDRQDDMLNMRTTGESNQFELKMLMKKMTFKDFGNLIIDHNITDENERKLNFGNQRDITTLDPRVCEEISSLIEKLNSFEDLPETKN